MNSRGFTLVELIVVMVMLAVLAAFSAPAIKTWLQNSDKNAIARDILSGLRHARSLAITENRNVTASINLDTHVLTYDGNQMPFSTNIKLEASVDNSTWVETGSIATTFDTRGSCSNLLYIRVDSDNNLTIQINSTASALARM